MLIKLFFFSFEETNADQTSTVRPQNQAADPRVALSEHQQIQEIFWSSEEEEHEKLQR